VRFTIFDSLELYPKRGTWIFYHIKETKEKTYISFAAISFTRYLCSFSRNMSMWIGISFFGEEKDYQFVFGYYQINNKTRNKS